MIGLDNNAQNLGVIPCAIAWLFKLINDQKEQTGARFSVRVSAVEVTGKQETLKDLLADIAAGRSTASYCANISFSFKALKFNHDVVNVIVS